MVCVIHHINVRVLIIMGIYARVVRALVLHRIASHDIAPLCAHLTMLLIIAICNTTYFNTTKGTNNTVIILAEWWVYDGCVYGNCTSPGNCTCETSVRNNATVALYGGTRCTEPICSTACENGGTCVEPDLCKCLNGFYGTACQNGNTSAVHLLLAQYI
jgi:hypothetical protein